MKMLLDPKSSVFQKNFCIPFEQLRHAHLAGGPGSLSKGRVFRQFCVDLGKGTTSLPGPPGQFTF